MSTNTPGVGDHATGPADDASAWEKFIHLEPAILRGILIALAAILAKVLGQTVVDNELIDGIIDLFVYASALITAVWIRPSVTANARVLAFKPRPFTSNTIVAGPATVDVDDREVAADVLTAARRAA